LTDTAGFEIETQELEGELRRVTSSWNFRLRLMRFFRPRATVTKSVGQDCKSKSCKWHKKVA